MEQSNIYEQIKMGCSSFITQYHYEFINQHFDRNEVAKNCTYKIIYSNFTSRQLIVILFIRDDNQITLNLQLLNLTDKNSVPFSLSYYLYDKLNFNEWNELWKLSNKNNLGKSTLLFFDKINTILDKHIEIKKIIIGSHWLNISYDWNIYR